MEVYELVERKKLANDDEWMYQLSDAEETGVSPDPPLVCLEVVLLSCCSRVKLEFLKKNPDINLWTRKILSVFVNSPTPSFVSYAIMSK